MRTRRTRAPRRRRRTKVSAAEAAQGRGASSSSQAGRRAEAGKREAAHRDSTQQRRRSAPLRPRTSREASCLEHAARWVGVRDGGAGSGARLGCHRPPPPRASQDQPARGLAHRPPCSAESDGEKSPCRAGDPCAKSGSGVQEVRRPDDDDDDDEDEDGERGPGAAQCQTSSPLTGGGAAAAGAPPEAAPRGGGVKIAAGQPDVARARRRPPASPSRGLWPRSPRRTSSSRALGLGCAAARAAGGRGARLSGAPPGGSPYPASPLLGRHLYYTRPSTAATQTTVTLNGGAAGPGAASVQLGGRGPCRSAARRAEGRQRRGQGGRAPAPEPHHRPPGGGYEPKKGRRPAGPRGRRAEGAEGPGGRAPGSRERQPGTCRSGWGKALSLNRERERMGSFLTLLETKGELVKTETGGGQTILTRDGDRLTPYD